jgi:hypothetical protein
MSPGCTVGSLHMLRQPAQIRNEPPTSRMSTPNGSFGEFLSWMHRRVDSRSVEAGSVFSSNK